MIKFPVVSYMRMELNTYPRKTPRFDVKYIKGDYQPFKQLISPDGSIYFYLQRSRNPSITTPDFYLQGYRSLNFTGLYGYKRNDESKKYAFGYPNKGKFLKSGSANPFYNYRNDIFLFVITENKEDINNIEAIVLKGCKGLEMSYFNALKDGVFDEAINKLRKGTFPFA